MPRGTNPSIPQDKLSFRLPHDVEERFLEGVSASHESFDTDATGTQRIDALIDRRLIGNLQHEVKPVLAQRLYRVDLTEFQRLANCSFISSDRQFDFGLPPSGD